MTQEFICFQKLIIGHLSRVKILNYIKNHLKKIIPLGNKPRNLFDFFNKFIKKRQIENYHPYPIRLAEKELLKYLKYITKIKKAEEKFGKKQLIKNKKTLKLFLEIATFFPTKVFIFYLTETQIKKLEKKKTQ